MTAGRPSAKEIKKGLDDRGDKALVINSFVGPKANPATGGEERTLYLSEKLKRLGGARRPAAPVQERRHRLPRGLRGGRAGLMKKRVCHGRLVRPCPGRVEPRAQ